MPARLISRVGKLKGDFPIDDEATLGRSSRNSIVLKPELLSNRHARIWKDSKRGCYMLEDLESSNGTRLDGEPVRRSEPLGHLHVITLAEHFDFIFIDEQRAAERHRGEGLAPVSVAQAVARRIGETSEITLLENLPLALPGFSGGKGAAGDGAVEGGLVEARAVEESREHTVMDKLSLPLPGFLQAGVSGEDGSVGRDLPATHLGDSANSPASMAGPTDRSETSDPDAVLAAYGFGRAHHMPTVSIPDDPQPIEPSLVEQPPEFSDTFFLEISTEEGPVRHRLKDGDNLVGRDPRADIRPSSPEVSRRHAVFVVSAGRLAVKDLGSRNKTFVEGQAITEEVVLKPGQEVRFGALEARVLAADGWEE